MTINEKTCKLSYAIMTHNEKSEFNRLMDCLEPFLIEDSEIVIVDDFSNSTMVEIIKQRNVKFLQRALDKDFGAQRNFTKSQCAGRFIFVLDPDEFPHPNLLKQIPAILEQMERGGVDGCIISRFNKLVESEELIESQIANILNSESLYLPAEDQLRIYRNSPNINWKRPLHEKLVGVSSILRLPNRIEYGIIHVKSRDRAIRQNKFYNSVGSIFYTIYIYLKFRIISFLRIIKIYSVIKYIFRFNLTQVKFEE